MEPRNKIRPRYKKVILDKEKSKKKLITQKSKKISKHMIKNTKSFQVNNEDCQPGTSSQSH